MLAKAVILETVSGISRWLSLLDRIIVNKVVFEEYCMYVQALIWNPLVQNEEQHIVTQKSRQRQDRPFTSAQPNCNNNFFFKKCFVLSAWTSLNI